MRLTFNKKSWHYNYFNWITGMEPPKTLCPYFWINVAITVFLPIILIVKFISYINIKFFTKKEKPYPKFVEDFTKEYLKTELQINFQKKKTKFYTKLGDLFGLFLIFVMAPLTLLYILYSIGLMIYVIPFDTLWTGILIIASVFVGWIIIYNFLKEISGIFKYLNPFNWKIIKIFWEIVKSVYKKACPLIEWKN